MSILQDTELKRRGKDLISPFYEEFVQPSSIELHLDNVLQVEKPIQRGVIYPNMDNSILFRCLNMLDEEDGYIMSPGDFVIGSTFETVNVPTDLVGRFEGKSSLGRLGLMTHVTAGFIDPGFNGNITVEIKNLTRFYWMLIPGMKIGQICFETLKDEVAQPYGSSELGSHYQGDGGPTLSKIHQNFKLHPHFERLSNG